MFIPKHKILKLIHKDKRFEQAYYKLIANRFYNIYEKLLLLQFKTIDKRFLFFIELQLKKGKIKPDLNGWIKLPYTIDKIADFINVERPSLSRRLSILAKKRKIIKKGNLIKINIKN